jgi:hypothetical protein
MTYVGVAREVPAAARSAARSTLETARLDGAEVSSPTLAPEAHARSLRAVLEAYGDYEFDLPVAGDEKVLVHVSLSEFRGRDLDSTFVLIGYERRFTYEEARALDLKDPLA